LSTATASIIRKVRSLKKENEKLISSRDFRISYVRRKLTAGRFRKNPSTLVSWYVFYNAPASEILL